MSETTKKSKGYFKVFTQCYTRTLETKKFRPEFKESIKLRFGAIPMNRLKMSANLGTWEL